MKGWTAAGGIGTTKTTKLTGIAQYLHHFTPPNFSTKITRFSLQIYKMPLTMRTVWLKIILGVCTLYPDRNKLYARRYLTWSHKWNQQILDNTIKYVHFCDTHSKWCKTTLLSCKTAPSSILLSNTTSKRYPPFTPTVRNRMEFAVI